MSKEILTLGTCRFEILEENGNFDGLGRIWIGERLVRSGRLAMNVTSQTFSGLNLRHLKLVDKKVSAKEIRLVLQAEFGPLFTKLMRDHSPDPIHDVGDWGQPVVAGQGKLTLVIRPASEAIF